MVETIARLQQNNLIRLKDDFCNWIEAKEGDELIIKDDKGKHGKFISIWKKGG